LAKVDNIKQITKEDYPSEYAELVDKLAFSINPLMRQITAAFNKQIDITNLTNVITEFEVTVLSSGIPINPTSIKVEPSKRLLGTTVIQVTNLTDGDFPVTNPFITYSVNQTMLNVNHVTGLAAEKRYKLRVLLHY
jgi:hypothetical protein